MCHSVQMITKDYKCYVFLMLACLYCAGAYAVSEDQLANGFAAKLTDYMRTQGQRGQFHTPDNHIISYQRFDKHCNDVAVIVVPGWSEPYLKYAEVIHDLRQYNYCVYTYDHRGQGLSSRRLTNTQIGHVDDFDSYVADLQQFDKQIVRSRRHRKVYILAHSMGGLIAVYYAAKTKQTIDGLILSAPMLKIKTGFWPEKVAYAIVSIMDWLGLGEHYVLGQGNWQVTPFADNRITHSRIRYEMNIDLLSHQPALIVAGISNRWLKTSLEHTWRLAALMPAIPQRILLFQTSQDQFVINSAEDDFCSHVTSCKKIIYKNAKHELLMESDSIRDDVFRRLVRFINSEGRLSKQ